VVAPRVREVAAAERRGAADRERLVGDATIVNEVRSERSGADSHDDVVHRRRRVLAGAHPREAHIGEHKLTVGGDLSGEGRPGRGHRGDVRHDVWLACRTLALVEQFAHLVPQIPRGKPRRHRRERVEAVIGKTVSQPVEEMLLELEHPHRFEHCAGHTTTQHLVRAVAVPACLGRHLGEQCPGWSESRSQTVGLPGSSLRFRRSERSRPGIPKNCTEP
jgi:hypothetical protein